MTDTIYIWKCLEDALFAAMAAVGFASISHTPRRTYVICALAAAIGHALRYVLMSAEVNISIIPASTIAAFAVGMAAVAMAPMVKVPAEACLFPALLPMIPGKYAYRTLEGMLLSLSGSEGEAFNHALYLIEYNGLTCVAVILGMVIGANLPIFLLKRISFQATR